MILKEYCDDIILDKRLSILESELSDGFVIETCEVIEECYDNEILEEATTNSEMFSKFKENIKIARKEFSSGKKALKEKNNNEAVLHFKKCLSIMDELEKYLRSIDDFDTKNKVVGNIIGELLQLGLYLITSISGLVFMIVQHNKINHAKRDNNATKYHIYSMYDKDVDGSFSGPIHYPKLNFTRIEGVNDLDTLMDNLDKNNNIIEKSKKNLNKGAIGIIVTVVLGLIKSTKTLIQLRKNGGTSNSINALRNKLIIYTMDIKKCFEAYIKLAKVGI